MNYKIYNLNKIILFLNVTQSYNINFYKLSNINNIRY